MDNRHMKVLVVTGRLAEKIVKKSVGDLADVYVCDIDVAAFITPKMLEGLNLSDYDLVLVPGLTKGNNWKKLEEKKGVKIRLGPIHAYDLKYVLKYVESIEFSHETPACRLIESKKAEDVINEVNFLEEDYVFKIRDIPIGGKSRMKVVAEIVDINTDNLTERIDYYIKSGADIVDLGIPLEFDIETINKAIKIAVDYSKVPVSIDTFSKKAIEIGVKHGVDMVMSISYKNLNALDVIDDQAVVVVERDVEKLVKLVNIAKNKTEKVIADPILDAPLSVAKSIVRYVKFREIDKTTPVLFGVGNVTELCDADSIGINALLAFIAEEIGCNLLFTTEASSKTIGSVKELKIATYMAKASKLRKTPPKDLGLNLLVLKEKVRYDGKELPKDYVRAVESKEFIRDPLGDFIIYTAKDYIVCKHDKITIIGKNAKEIFDTILRYGLVSRLDHASYLGRELKKAEIALKLNKNYIQDRELNFGYFEKWL